jgi:hypothetical protein
MLQMWSVNFAAIAGVRGSKRRSSSSTSIRSVLTSRVKLRTAHLVIAKQDLFDPFHLWRGLDEPGADSLFLDAFDAMDGGQRISFGQHREALDDCSLVVLFAMEDRSLGFGDDLFTGRALPSLAAFAGESEFPQVPCIDSTIVATLFIPAKGIRCG